MAIKAVTTHDVVQYVSPRDSDYIVHHDPIDPEHPEKGTTERIEHGKNATKFILSPLDYQVRANLEDGQSAVFGESGSAKIQIMPRVNQTNIDAVRFGLKGFLNFKDKDGKVVKFETVKGDVQGKEYDLVSDETMKAIDYETLIELGAEIRRISRLTSAQEKNSDGGQSLSV